MKIIPYRCAPSSTPPSSASAPSRMGTAPFSPAHATKMRSPHVRRVGSRNGMHRERTRDERQQHGEHEAVPPRVARTEIAEADRQAERDERGDLGQSGE